MALQSFSALPRHFTYNLEADSSHPSGHLNAIRMAGYEAAMIGANWNSLIEDYEHLGFDTKGQS